MRHMRTTSETHHLWLPGQAAGWLEPSTEHCFDTYDQTKTRRADSYSALCLAHPEWRESKCPPWARFASMRIRQMCCPHMTYHSAAFPARSCTFLQNTVDTGACTVLPCFHQNIRKALESSKNGLGTSTVMLAYSHGTRSGTLRQQTSRPQLAVTGAVLLRAHLRIAPQHAPAAKAVLEM